MRETVCHFVLRATAGCVFCGLGVGRNGAGGGEGGRVKNEIIQEGWGGRGEYRTKTGRNNRILTHSPREGGGKAGRKDRIKCYEENTYLFLIVRVACNRRRWPSSCSSRPGLRRRTAWRSD